MCLPAGTSNWLGWFLADRSKRQPRISISVPRGPDHTLISIPQAQPATASGNYRPQVTSRWMATGLLRAGILVDDLTLLYGLGGWTVAQFEARNLTDDPFFQPNRVVLGARAYRGRRNRTQAELALAPEGRIPLRQVRHCACPRRIRVWIQYGVADLFALDPVRSVDAVWPDWVGLFLQSTEIN